MIAQDGVTAGIPDSLQTLENDGARGVRVLLKQFADQRLEGIELAGARTADRRRHGSHAILFHSAGGQVELPGDAAHRPMLAAGEAMNFVDLLKA